MHYQSWCSLSEEELAQRDIAEVNLAAAFDCPNAVDLDIKGLLCTVDRWTDLVDTRTRQAFATQRHRPEYQDYSDAQFSILAMVTVLHRELGVRYNLPFTSGPYDGSDSRNLFIHGLLTGHGGTCVTMPVLCAAIGRRLGYPIKVVLAKAHVFCRWDDPVGERFNIEATNGFASDPDEHYLTWPRPITPREVERCGYLRSLSPREELAIFLENRGHCFVDNFMMGRAMEAYFYAHRLAPHLPEHKVAWGVATILHRALKRSPQSLSWDSVRIPPPIETWERQFCPLAEQELLRIRSNWKHRREGQVRAKVFEEAFSNSA